MINSDLRSNLSRLVAKLAVEIEQMHDEQQQQQQCCGSCGGGRSGRGESDDSDASSGVSARQKSLNAILELIRDIEKSLDGGNQRSPLSVSEQVQISV